jgi:hypothetical protein
VQQQQIADLKGLLRASDEKFLRMQDTRQAEIDELNRRLAKQAKQEK